MAKIKVIVPKNFLSKERKKVNKSINASLQLIGEKLIKDIRSGKDPETGKSYKAITRETTQRRKRLSTVNATARNYSPRKSNLTFTGRFLQSFKFFIKGRRGNKSIEIKAAGAHKGYNLIRGGKSKSVKNSDILKGQQSMGRNPLSIGKKTTSIIKKIIERALRRGLG